MPAIERSARCLDELREQGLDLAREEPYEHTVPFSQRSGERIEPLVSLQWFMRMDELAEPAIEVVREGRVRFHPPSNTRVYMDWMENIRPWVISRQLWWGHRLPVWYRGDETYVGVSAPDGDGWERDPDVLDTWFSSALWPFATLGWPDRDPRAPRVLPDRRARHRARHHLPLGRPDDHDGARVHGRDPVLRRPHPRDHPGARRPADVEVARNRDRSARPDRGWTAAAGVRGGRLRFPPTAPTRCDGACSRWPPRRTCASARSGSPRASS